MKRISIYLIGIIIAFTACEKTVTIDVPQKEPRLVVHGLLEKDQLIQLFVTKSRGVLQPVNYQTSTLEQYVVKTAVPVIYENNVPIDTLVYNPADYQYKTNRNSRIRDGFTYTLRVVAPGFTMAEANSVLPSQSVIAGINRVKNARTNSGGETVDDITITLNDPVAEKNFYLVQIWGAGNPFSGSNIWCVSTTDKDLERIGDDTDILGEDNCFDGSALLMKDVNFNGRQKQLKISVTSYNLQEFTDPGTRRTYRPFVKVYRITEDQFKFVKSYSAYTSAGDNPFAEPANVFSNLKNGYGIFAVSTVAIDTLR